MSAPGFGSYIVDEVHRFSIYGLALRDGIIWVYASMPGPLVALPDELRQVIVLGSDGQTVLRARVTIGWEAIADGGTCWLEQPLSIDNPVGCAPW